MWCEKWEARNSSGHNKPLNRQADTGSHPLGTYKGAGAGGDVDDVDDDDDVVSCSLRTLREASV